MTNVYELYQGLTPIKLVYRNGKIVWKPPVFLFPHLAYLDLNAQINVVDSSVVAKALLVNRILTEYYDSRNVLGAGHALPLYQIHDDFVEKYTTYIDGDASTFSTNMIAKNSSERAFTSDELHALVSHGKVYDHSTKFKLLVEMVEHASTFESVLTSHYANYAVDVDSILSALSVDTELVRHIDNNAVRVDHLNTAMCVDVESCDHTEDHTVSIGKLNNGLSADTIQCEYDSTVMAEADSEGSVIPAPSKQGRLDKVSDVYYDHSAYLVEGLSSNRLTYEFTEKFEHSDDSTLSTLAINSVAFEDTDGVYSEELHVSDAYGDCLNKDLTVGISVSHSHVPDTMIWVFPEQAVSDLYIPGLYDDGVFVNAVQNGSELAI